MCTDSRQARTRMGLADLVCADLTLNVTIAFVMTTIGTTSICRMDRLGTDSE
jgi:hypothetical protein